MAYIFIDGAYSPKKNIGGWSFIIADDNHVITKLEYGKTRKGIQSSERSELEALYQALLYLSKNDNHSSYVLYSDSETLVKCMAGILQRKAHRDLWDKIEEIIPRFCSRIRAFHVKSHTDEECFICKCNDICDKSAKAGAHSLIHEHVNN